MGIECLWGEHLLAIGKEYPKQQNSKHKVHAVGVTGVNTGRSRMDEEEHGRDGDREVAGNQRDGQSGTALKPTWAVSLQSGKTSCLKFALTAQYLLTLLLSSPQGHSHTHSPSGDLRF